MVNGLADASEAHKCELSHVKIKHNAKKSLLESMVISETGYIVEELSKTT